MSSPDLTPEMFLDTLKSVTPMSDVLVRSFTRNTSSDQLILDRDRVIAPVNNIPRLLMTIGSTDAHGDIIGLGVTLKIYNSGDIPRLIAGNLYTENFATLTAGKVVDSRRAKGTPVIYRYEVLTDIKWRWSLPTRPARWFFGFMADLTKNLSEMYDPVHEQTKYLARNDLPVPPPPDWLSDNFPRDWVEE